MLEATNSWSANIENGFLNGVVFIDLNKAFDTIDHEIILRKLSYFGADQATIKWFQSYLSDRTQRCNVNGSLSTTSTVTCGALQGNILGPLPFLMYTNDLPNCLRDAAPRMFADDTNITLFAKTVADLKLAVTSELNNLTCWLRAKRLSLSVAKTELMIIGSRQRLHAQCDEIDICIDDKMINSLDHFARISHVKFKEFNKTIIPLYALGSALALYYWQVFGFSFSHPQTILLLHLSCCNCSG